MKEPLEGTDGAVKYSEFSLVHALHCGYDTIHISVDMGEALMGVWGTRTGGGNIGDGTVLRYWQRRVYEGVHHINVRRTLVSPPIPSERPY